MNFHISIPVRRAILLAVVSTCALSASAQTDRADSKDELTAAQRVRVRDALGKLAPVQLPGCWLSARASTLIGLIAPTENTGARVRAVTDGADPPLSTVRPGDLLESVDGKVIAPDAGEGLRAVSKARLTAFERLGKSGRGFIETYKNAQGEMVSVANPVRLECTANYIFIPDQKSDRAAARDLLPGNLVISASRLALLDDDQLVAFLAWNHAFVALRNESNADVWRGLTLLANGAPANYEYGSGVHEKIDWVTLSLLRAMNANLNAYASMIAVVQAFDKAAAVQLIGSKRFIDTRSGGSPFADEEKQARLSAWVILLEADADAPSPSALKFSNALLSRPMQPARAIPLPMFQTVEEALRAFLGETQAKAVAGRYMANTDTAPTLAEVQSTTPGGAPRTPAFQMMYAHHPSKRLLWLTRKAPDQGDGDICVRPSDCSVLVVGPYAIARPSPAWAQELSATPGAYTLEELKQSAR